MRVEERGRERAERSRKGTWSQRMRPVPRSWTTTICVRGLYILWFVRKIGWRRGERGQVWQEELAKRCSRSQSSQLCGRRDGCQPIESDRSERATRKRIRWKVRAAENPNENAAVCATRFLLKPTPLLLASRASQLTTRTKQRTSWRRRCARWRLDRRTERDVGRQASTVWWAAHLQAGR